MNRLTLLTRRVYRHGLLGTLELVPVNIRWAWRRLKPSNIAERRREHAFDREFGIETASPLTRGQLEAEWKDPKSPTGYQAVSQVIFNEMITSLPIDPASFCFMDIGSGKGRALVLAAQYGFPLVIGIELSPQLHAVAEKNFARIGPSLRATVRILNLDARDFEFPGTPSVVYLFNPFQDEGITRTVVRNVERAHLASEKPVFVLYHWPVHEYVLTERGIWKEFSRGHYRRDWGFQWKAFSFIGAQGHQ
jgi:SAM-dependent methyltransferase